MPFTPEELAELAAFDAEVDAAPLTLDDYRAVRQLDKLVGPDKRAARSSVRRTREMYLAYQAAYRAAHREELRAYAKAYDAAHPEQRRARNRRYYESHRDEILARRRACQAKKRGGDEK